MSAEVVASRFYWGSSSIHFCHNVNTQLCHPHCKKYKDLKKLYLPCSCKSLLIISGQGLSSQSTNFHCPLEQVLNRNNLLWLLISPSFRNWLWRRTRQIFFPPPPTNYIPWFRPTAPPKHSAGWQKKASVSLVLLCWYLVCLLHSVVQHMLLPSSLLSRIPAGLSKAFPWLFWSPKAAKWVFLCT